MEGSVKKMNYDVYLIDVFTNKPGKGNAAGLIFNPPEPLDAEDFQQLAGELGVSEVVAILPRGEEIQGGSGCDANAETELAACKVDYQFRFFAPKEEVALCGHGTIGAIALLFERGFWAGGEGSEDLRILTKAGLILGGRLDRGLYYMHQQLPQFFPAEVDAARVAAILGIAETDLLGPESGLPLQMVSTGRNKLMVPVRSLEILHGLQPDFAAMERYSREIGTSGFHVFTPVTVSGKPGTHARHFAPTAGVAEDPVTGVAAGALGAYLVKYGVFDEGLVTRIYMEQGHVLGKDGVLAAEISRDDSGAFIGVKVCGGVAKIFAL